MRKTPMIVFINKMDREGKDGFDLLDEIEKKLELNVVPLSWPVGMGQRFKGVYNLVEKKLNLFQPHGKQSKDEIVEITDTSSILLEEHVGTEAAKELKDDLEIVTTVYPEFDADKYLSGEQSPVFFGSAINNFGVKELLDCFIHIAPTPLPREAEERIVDPEEKKFSGFVFKIHANMDPKHRDRIAFMRICSGKFERNKNYQHVRKEKKIRFSNPTAFMASKKSIVDMAFPGDIVGLYDSGNFKIGDTLTEGESLHFKGMPSFSPEQFRYINNANPLKSKQLQKGIEQLTEEGVAQLFVKEDNARKIIGTVGALQFEVIQYRLEHEYGASCAYEPLQLHKACWLTAENDADLYKLIKERKKDIARDKEGIPVFLAESAWALKMARENYPGVEFHFTSEL